MSVAEKVETEAGRDFIRDIVADDLAAGRHKSVVTRFPPEPNGYLHIGHAKSICLNFGVAQEFGGHCNLRFDDTNPTKEEQEYIDAIEADVRWLGFDWGKNLFHASDYFERLYGWAEELIRSAKAYVDDQTQEQMRLTRGTLTEPGQNSPFRERSVEENLDLFRRMRAGEFPNGARVLRAKIDMASGNINLRDPVLYRILHATHPRTGETWKIYPSYDYAHGQSDAIEGVTHSICTLEFEDHRPLYDWFLENLPVPSHPHQYEFARLNLTYTVLSKRVLNALVKGGHVSGWDDPRMPTLAALRRRGVPPAALRDFAKRIGVAKANSLVDLGVLDFSIREVLNKSAQRRMAVLKPLKVVIENYEGPGEELDAVNHPDDPAAGTRRVQFRPRDLHRAGRLHGEPAEEVLPAFSRHRGAAALCVFHHVRERGEGRERQHHRAALHLRSGDARRQRTGRAQGEGDDPLGVGGGQRAGRSAAVQSAVHETRAGRGELCQRPQSEFARGVERRPRRAGAGGRQFARAGAVRAARLFRARQGRRAGQAGVQPHRRPARQLREGRRQIILRVPGPFPAQPCSNR